MGGKSIGVGKGSGGDVYKGSAESVLVSLSDLYSDDDKILVSDSKYSSYCCGNHLSQRINDLTNE